MPRAFTTPLTRATGALRGALAGARAARASPGLMGLTRDLAEELAEGRTDLRRLVERWTERHRAAPQDFDPETGSALRHLATYHAPPEEAEGRGSAPLARTLPVALVAAASPRNLVSATFHIAALTHPDPASAWSAVAVNVALARLLQDRRDFVPEVIEVLRANGAPEALLGVARRVPVERRPPPEVVAACEEATIAAGVALWLAYHEPQCGRALEWLTETGAAAPVAVAAGALLGARDGAEAVPAHLLPGTADLAGWDDLASRLTQVATAAQSTPV